MSLAQRPELGLAALNPSRGVRAFWACALFLLTACVACGIWPVGPGLTAVAAGTFLLAATGAAAALRRMWRWATAPGGRRSVADLLMFLSPFPLFAVAYPLASGRIVGARLDGVPVDSVLLAVALTVPWLGNVACLPLYAHLGALCSAPLPEASDTRASAARAVRDHRAAVRACFVAVWPRILLLGAAWVLPFAALVFLAARWSAAPLSAFAGSCLLHLALAQSLVPVNVTRDRVRWMLAWTAYTAAFVACPTWWFAPPLAGLAVTLPPLAAALRSGEAPAASAAVRPVVVDMAHGLVLGSVLWADKLFAFLRQPDAPPVTTMFLGFLPAVLMYNLYFVQVAPTFDATVARFRSVMSGGAHGLLHGPSRRLSGVVDEGLATAAMLAGALVALLGASVALLAPSHSSLVYGVAIASWCLVMTSLVSYKLDYIGQRRPVLVIGTVHLVLCSAVFALLPIGPWSYACLTGGEVLLLGGAVLACQRHWRSPEFTLFWSRATAW